MVSSLLLKLIALSIGHTAAKNAGKLRSCETETLKAVTKKKEKIAGESTILRNFYTKPSDRLYMGKVCSSGPLVILHY